MIIHLTHSIFSIVTTILFFSLFFPFIFTILLVHCTISVVILHSHIHVRVADLFFSCRGMSLSWSKVLTNMNIFCDWLSETITLVIFAQFSPTCAGSYCQRTPHKKYLAANETQRFRFFISPLENLSPRTGR